MTAGGAKGTVERIEPTKAQRAAARRVAESKATIPHLYMSTEVRLEHADRGGTERAMATVAGAVALRAVPEINGAYRDGASELYSRINIGFAMRGPEGMVVPTIFDADRKGESEIARELGELRDKVSAGTLTAAETAGGTFTIAWADGMIDAYGPVIHGGQAANLGIGGIADRVLVGADGSPVVGAAMTATLSADARIVDAEAGHAFLDRFRAALEAPNQAE